MKIRVYSDIHNEFHRDYPWIPPVLDDEHETVLVLAGDIDFLKYAVEYANDMSGRFKHVILVPGNHEYYHKSSKLGEEYKLQTNDNVHLMLKDKIIIDGIMFVGATFWTNIPLSYDVQYNIKRGMNDFRMIRWGDSQNYRRFNLDDWIAEHQSAIAYFENAIYNSPHNMKIVCVTHHAPSFKSNDTDDKRRTSLDHAYYSDYDQLVDEVTLWIHGHTHHNVDYTIGRGRVVSNCRGYHQVIGGDTVVPYEHNMPVFDELGLQIQV